MLSSRRKRRLPPGRQGSEASIEVVSSQRPVARDVDGVLRRTAAWLRADPRAVVAFAERPGGAPGAAAPASLDAALETWRRALARARGIAVARRAMIAGATGALVAALVALAAAGTAGWAPAAAGAAALLLALAWAASRRLAPGPGAGPLDPRVGPSPRGRTRHQLRDPPRGPPRRGQR